MHIVNTVLTKMYINVSVYLRFKYVHLFCHLNATLCMWEKGRNLTQSYDKSPCTHRKLYKTKWQHKNTTKNFDYTAIADRLRTVSWGNDSHPTGVVKPVNAHEGLGVKSRMCPPYPQRDRKRRLNGAVCRNHRIKRVVPCRC